MRFRFPTVRRRVWAVALGLGAMVGTMVGAVLIAPPGALCFAQSAARFGTCAGANRGEMPHLVMRAGRVWRDGALGFGGLSGVIVAPGGTQITVLSDHAQLFTADISRDPDSGAITATAPARPQALLDQNGRPLTPFNSDAEDLAPNPDPGGRGDIFISFEGLTRVALFPAAPPEMGTGRGTGARTAVPLHPWNRFEDRFGNTGFEALAPLPGPPFSKGGLLAIGETAVPGVDPAGAAAFVYTQGQWAPAFDIPDPGGFAISGADLGPEGRLWLLERRLGWGGFVTRVRRFSLSSDGTDPVLEPVLGAGETLLEAHLGPRDNYEGIAVWCDNAGRTVVTLVSDDGFSIWQRTTLVEFELATADPPCG